METVTGFGAFNNIECPEVVQTYGDAYRIGITRSAPDRLSYRILLPAALVPWSKIRITGAMTSVTRRPYSLRGYFKSAHHT